MFQQSGCFTIDVSIQTGRPFLHSNRECILRMPRSHWYSIFHPPMMQADPFLFVRDDTLYLFYEYMPIGKGLGVIMVRSTKDLKCWSKPVQITNEPECHFSYPYVFEEDGVIYMIPETGCEHNIRLYKAINDDLTEWILDKILLERPLTSQEFIKYDYADSCIYKKNNKYFLFTSYFKNNEYFLELYVADSLKGPYKSHPSSPLCRGNKFGRNAGSLIDVNGNLYRPTQDCWTTYGRQVHLMQIDELNPMTYSEHVVKENLLPEDEWFYRNGGHHINFAEFLGKTIVAADAGYTTSFFLERVRIKLLKLLRLKENKPY